MANAITVTSVTGPGQAVTATVFNNLTDLNFQLTRGVLQITAGGIITDVSLTPVTTITITVSSGVYTATIS